MSPGVSDKQANKHLTLLNMAWKKPEEPKLEELSEKELEAVTMVFRSFETGLREATIYSKDLLAAMKMLGLNPMEQEIIDLTNEIARNGLIYFPEFCRIVHQRFRDQDEEVFRQNMFKLLCGTDPLPELYRAKKYKIHEHFLTKEDFKHMMMNLPEEVSEEDIEEMFTYADKDGDGKISYTEFKIMINPPKPPEQPRPTLADLARKTQMEVRKETDKFKPNETQTTIITDKTESKMSPETTIPEPQTLSVANILIHNANTKDAPLKGPKPKKEKGGKKGKEGKENGTAKK